MSATFSVVVATPPPGFSGTWADFVTFLNNNNQGALDVDWSSFVVGSVEPSSNVGPWLKDGKSWHWWDATYGKYVPIDARIPSPYTVSITEPAAPVADPNGILPTPPRLWLQIDASGHIVDWHYWSGSAWVPSFIPVTAASEPGEIYRKRIWTKTDANGYPIGQYRWNPTTSVWVNMDTFWIQPLVPGPLPVTPDPEPEPDPVIEDERKKPWLKLDDNGYPTGLFLYDPTFQRWRDARRSFAFSYGRYDDFQVASGSDQVVLGWQAKNFDLYNTVSANRFTAPVAGVYHFDLAIQWVYTSGTFLGKTLAVYLRRNQAPLGVVMSDNADEKGQWLANMSRTWYLNAGDQVDVSVEIGVPAQGECLWTVGTSATTFSGFLVEEVLQ